MDRTCDRCDAPLRTSSRYCPSCGAPTAEYQHEQRAERIERTRAAWRVAAALLLVFGGVLAAVAVLAVDAEALDLAVALRFHLVLVGLGLLGATVAGRGALRASLAGPATSRALGVGVLGGLAWLVLNVLYVRLIAVLSGLEAGSFGVRLPPPSAVLLVAVLPALTEEWLCRGVLWETVRRAVPPAGTILVTAALFGLLHGLQGFLWLPHRFLGGVLLGVLRHRTGSLLPGIVAHFANNVLALALLG